MIVQERLARNYDAVRKFQKSFWGYLRMGEYICKCKCKCRDCEDKHTCPLGFWFPPFGVFIEF